MGISGLRHHCACVFHTATIAVGTYAELAASFQISAAQGTPETMTSLAIDGSLSIAGGISVEGTFSFVPVSIRRPTLDRPHLVEYKCVGLGLSLGLATPGGGVALGVTATRSFVLPGILK